MYAIVNRFVLVAITDRLTIKHRRSDTLACTPCDLNPIGFYSSNSGGNLPPSGVNLHVKCHVAT
jgi:hypothetical protein